MAAQILANGGSVEIAGDDLLDPAAARSLADDMCAGKAEIDASFDPLSNDDVQGTMLSDLDVDELAQPG